MSDPVSTPTFCGCGSLDPATTPVSLVNRPGLSALAYRVGTHGRFKQALLSALSRRPEFADLTTRYDSDPTIALLDGWAAVLDVLAFYQERIANEGFLRTATERRSILELARAIGYELGPGVAASTFLAFTVDHPIASTTQAIAASTPSEIALAVGTRAQSIPGPGELPQTFETVEETILRPEWNALKPRTGRLQLPILGATHLYLDGTSTNLNAGDSILIVGAERTAEAGSERWDMRRLLTVTPDFTHAVTQVTWAEGLGSTRFGHVTLPAASDVKVYAFRTRASIFGHNAQDWSGISDTLKADYLWVDETLLSSADRVQWPSYTIYSPVYPPQFIPNPAGSTRRPLPLLTTDTIDLDNVYSGIVVDSWLALAKPDLVEIYQVAAIVEATRAEYLLSAKVSRLQLSRFGSLLGEHLNDFAGAVRETAVLAQAEELALGDEPIVSDVSGSSLELDALVDGLEAGRPIAVSGIDTATGEIAGEVVMLDRTEVVDGLTRLVFETSLQRTYRRDDLVVNANVVRATHGETKTEILGSGDGSQEFQVFILKHRPLTLVSAATARGVATTLEVRVDGVLWEEVPSLYGQGPEARVYITRRADDGTTSIRFGDGVTGARLPTGQDNVTATYRVGIGTGALVNAGQISLLMSRPLGLKEVVNPAAPTGAADPEVLEDARQNAPLTVLTLDRIVSLQDHEDFARAFAGISKARATLLWNGEQRLVHLTVAGVDGAEVEAASDLFANLRTAIDLARHADQEVRIGSYSNLTFDVAAQIKVDAACLAADVLAEVELALNEAFSFGARSFAQGIVSSEIVATMQRVEGVEAVILDEFCFTGQTPSSQPRLPAADARWNSAQSEVLPAELLVVNPDGITLIERIGLAS